MAILIKEVSANKEQKLPQDVCAIFGTAFIPSHGGSTLQFVASPAFILIVFPVHKTQESPLLKYPTLQT